MTYLTPEDQLYEQILLQVLYLISSVRQILQQYTTLLNHFLQFRMQKSSYYLCLFIRCWWIQTLEITRQETVSGLASLCLTSFCCLLSIQCFRLSCVVRGQQCTLELEVLMQHLLFHNLFFISQGSHFTANHMEEPYWMRTKCEKTLEIYNSCNEQTIETINSMSMYAA